MTNKEAIEVFEKWKGCRDLVFAKNEIECNGSCDNCEFNIEGEHTFDEAVEAAIEALKEKIKPFVTVANISVNERPHGKWLVTPQHGDCSLTWITRCSNCKIVVEPISAAFMNYCPNCGIKMRGEENDK